MGNLDNPTLRRAMSSVATRAERVEDPAWLVATFVDNGIIDLVNNNKNQIIHGRRGTGKTHLFRVLETKMADDPSSLVCYLDARTLGSNLLFTDLNRPIHMRCSGLFKDIISFVHNRVVEWLIESQTGNVDGALETLSEIERQLIYTESDSVTKQEVISEQRSSDSGAAASVGLSAQGPRASGTLTSGQSRTESAQMQRQSSERNKVVIPALHQSFAKLLSQLELQRLVILIDEWASLPIDLQPFLAEFLNRVFFANPRITVKIATLEFRSQFTQFSPDGTKTVGLELGGDIETAIDLDDFYVYDRNPAGTEEIFGELLFRHVSAALTTLGEDTYLKGEHGVETASAFRHEFFTPTAFEALVRASEGVARDLLQVCSRSHQRAVMNHNTRITNDAVTNAAQEWYESDKQQNLSEQQHHVLEALVGEVIGNRRARSFMVRREDSSSQLLRSLIDQRVVHVTKKGYADKDNPGIRYNIYTLDYGCYVELKNTQREPHGYDEFTGSAEDLVVPFDDNRSIRRIIVPRELLAAD